MLFAAFPQDGQGHVVYADSGFGLAGKGSVMRVPVQCKRGPVLVERSLQARASEEGKDRFGLAYHRVLDGRIVHDGHFDRSLQLLEPVIELDGFALGNLDGKS